MNTTYAIKREAWEIIIWLLVFITIIILNSSILYTVCLIARKSTRKSNHKATYHGIISSNFVANMVYSAGRIAEECMVVPPSNTTQPITLTLNFFKSIGELTCIFGALSLSSLQYWKLRKLSINNKVINFFNTKKIHRRKTFVWLFAIWTFSAVISSFSLSGSQVVELIRIGVVTLGIGFTPVFSFTIIRIISKHRRMRCNSFSRKSANITKSKSVIKGNCILIIIAWLPTVIGQFIMNISHQSKEPGLRFLVKTALVSPIIHPLMYLATHREIRQLMLKRFFKCQSKEEEINEEFYMRLRVRKRFRRSIQIQPFIVAKDLC